MQNEQYPERQGGRSLTFAAQQNQADRTEPRTSESGFRRNHTHRNFGRTPLVVGHSPGRSHLGDNGEGYGIIRESHIPVLSV